MNYLLENGLLAKSHHRLSMTTQSSEQKKRGRKNGILRNNILC